MSTENVDIVVNEKGAQQASQNIRTIGGAADSAAAQLNLMQGALNSLRNVMGLVGFAVTAKEILDTADSHARLVNQIKQTVSSSEELAEVYQKLFQMSQDTRTSFARNVDVFKTLKESTRDFGTSTDQITTALKVMNQVMVADGAGAEDVSGALRMLAFSMSTGTIEGRGLHALLLQFPDLGRLIADGLGVTTKQLNDMGMAGQLTTQKLLGVLTSTDAIRRAQEAFAKVNITVSGAFQVLQNSILNYIGTVDTAQGASAALANAILFVANHLATIASIALEVGAAFAAIKLAEWGAAATAAFANAVFGALRFGLAMTGLLGPARMLAATTTLITGGFNLIIPAIGAAIAYILQFGQAIKLTQDGSISLRGVVVGTFNYITDAIGRAYTAIVQWFESSALGQFLVEVLNKIATAIGNVATWAIKGLEALGLLSKGGSSEFDLLKNSIVAASTEAKKMGGDFAESSAKIIRGAANAQTATKAMEDSMKNLGTATDHSAGSFSGHSATVRNAMGEEVKVISDWAARSGAYFNEVDNSIKSTVDEMDKLSAASDKAMMSSQFSTEHIMSAPSSSKSSFIDLSGGVDFASGGKLSSTHSGGTGFGNNTTGFASGGSFMVGGQGGTDSQLVHFMATPGEQVSVQTPGQQAAGGKAGRAINVQVAMTVNATDAASFSRNTKTLAMQLQSQLTRAARSIGNN